MGIMNVLQAAPVLSPPPPPPPVVGTNDVWAGIVSQSNQVASGSAPDFVAKYQQLKPGRTAEFFNQAVGSTQMRPGGGYRYWQPGPDGLLDAALTAYKAKIASNPNNVARGAISHIGENDAVAAASLNALKHATDAVAIFAYVRAQLGLTPEQFPVIFVELHQQPSSSDYPYWADVQFQIRKITNPSDPYGYVPNSYLVSIADLAGDVPPDGLHLGAAKNTILQQRLAIMAASIQFPGGS